MTDRVAQPQQDPPSQPLTPRTQEGSRDWFIFAYALMIFCGLSVFRVIGVMWVGIVDSLDTRNYEAVAAYSIVGAIISFFVYLLVLLARVELKGVAQVGYLLGLALLALATVISPFYQLPDPLSVVLSLHLYQTPPVILIEAGIAVQVLAWIYSIWRKATW